MRTRAMGTVGEIHTTAHEPVRGVVPASWLRRWVDPPAEDRPLQIIHGVAPVGRGPAAGGETATEAGPDEAIESRMRFYKQHGLGGVVCNVMFEQYMRSERAWEAVIAGVDACQKLGLVTWIYDEAGYPSGAAGGLVLKEHPEYEAQELAYDAALPDPFVLRPAYEFTHASNNYYASRRYINLIDDRAVRAFIATTHQAYRERLGDALGSSVKAFFTDEPSLITVNLGQIPDSARKNVPVEDALDPAVRPLPAVPWAYDLPERYQERYGEDLIAVRGSLFTGSSPADRQARERYWALIADLCAERYFGAIRRWCKGAGLLSSGHSLWEESLLHHPALYGNALKALSLMDLPGCDELSSTPDAVLNADWLTAALPASAAILNGGRRVFTEISDFSEKLSGLPPAPLADMQAAAGWQAAFGVTDFTLYYDIHDRSADDTRAYCACVGRLNAVLKPARLDPETLLYYPVRDLWAEYLPVSEPLSLDSQTAVARSLVGSFNALGQALTRSQLPFALIDHEFLAGASVRADGRLVVRGHAFRAVVLPDGVVLPQAAAAVVRRFEKVGGIVLRDRASDRLTGWRLVDAIGPAHRLTEPTEQVVMGRFTRAGRTVLLLVNVGQTHYTGGLTVGGGSWTCMDPTTGSVEPARVSEGAAAISLPPRALMLLVGGG